LSLGKISSNDITPIMDKYRLLAAPSGYIQLNNLGVDSTEYGDSEQDQDQDSSLAEDEVQDLAFAD